MYNRCPSFNCATTEGVRWQSEKTPGEEVGFSNTKLNYGDMGNYCKLIFWWTYELHKLDMNCSLSPFTAVIKVTSLSAVSSARSTALLRLSFKPTFPSPKLIADQMYVHTICVFDFDWYLEAGLSLKVNRFLRLAMPRILPTGLAVKAIQLGDIIGMFSKLSSSFSKFVYLILKRMFWSPSSFESRCLSYPQTAQSHVQLFEISF